MRNTHRTGSSMLRRVFFAIISAAFVLFSGYLAYPLWHQYSLTSRLLVERDAERHPEPIQKKTAILTTNQSYTYDNIAVVGREFFNYLASQLRDTPYPGVDSYIQYTTARLGLKPLNIQSMRPDFGSVINDVTSYKYLIEPASASCRPVPTSAAKRRTLLIVVISAPNYFSKRQVIRSTWRHHLSESFTTDSIEVVGFTFVTGVHKSYDVQQKIKQESEKYGDVLQIEMTDTYYNLTVKLAGLMNWLHRKCEQVDFVLKVDDDIYVNVRNLVAVIMSNDPASQQVFGSGITNPPLRTGKWGLSYEEWPWNEYPYYLSGATVLLTGNVISPLLAAIQVTPFLPFEDVYLTGLCLEKTNTTVMHSPRMLVQNINLKYQVQDSVTCLTDSTSQMFKLHMATNVFYKQKIYCSDSPSPVTDISMPIPCVIDFEFSPYIQELYMHA